MADPIDLPFELGCDQLLSIKKHGTEAVRAEFDQRHPLPVRRHLEQALGLHGEVVIGHTHRATIEQDQAFERVLAVTRDVRHTLVGDREQVPPRLTGITVVEHPQFVTRDVLLDQRVEFRGFEIATYRSQVSRDDNSGPALSRIGLQHDGVVETVVLDEPAGRRDANVGLFSVGDQARAGNDRPRTGQPLEDAVL